MTNGPIREILRATETSYAVEGSTYKNLYFTGNITRNDNFARKLIRVHNGTYTGATLKALGGRHSVLSVQVPLLYDQAGYWLCDLLGYPVSTALSGGAYQHIFPFPAVVASGASGYLSGSFQVYNNVRWVKMLGARANTGKFSFSATDEPTIDLAYIGQSAVGQVDGYVPNPHPDAVCAYDPAGARALEVNVGGVLANLIKATVDFDNKLVPFWVARRSADMLRLKRNGLADLKFDATFDWTGYTGSVKEKFDGEDDLGLFEAEWVDTGTKIASTDYYPTALLSLKNLIIEATDEPDDQGESANHATGQGSYDSGTKVTGSIKLINATTSYVSG